MERMHTDLRMQRVSNGRIYSKYFVHRMKVFYIPLLANDAELAITSLIFLLSQQNRTFFMYMCCTQKLTVSQLVRVVDGPRAWQFKV